MYRKAESKTEIQFMVEKAKIVGQSERGPYSTFLFLANT